MGAEDVRHLQGTRPHGGGLLRLQCFQRADHFFEHLGGYLGIERRGLQLLVAQHDLNHPDVDLLLQQMGCKAVAPIPMSE